MISKLEKRFLFVAFTVIILGGFIIIADWVDRTYKTVIDGVYINQPLYNIKSTVLDTDKKVYKGGETIAVQWDMCKGTNDVATISVNLKNHIITQMTPVSGTKTVGCYKTLDTIVPIIPTNLISGEYFAEVDVAYQVNEKSVIHYKFTTKPFLIDNDN